MTGSIEEEIPHILDLLVGLLALAAFVAVLVRPLRLPYTVALVVAGLTVGIVANVTGYPPVDVSPDLVLLVLLPGLVFEAAYRLRIVELRRWFGGLLLLAIPGVVISAAVVAAVLNVATGLRLDLAFIVGAMVSATDPAAVIATFKRLTVPPALSTMVDGESLLNDGTGLVLFAIAVSAVYAPVSPVEAVTSFVGTVVLSVAIGLATGYAAAKVIAPIADHLIELTITVVLAYGSYLLADQLGLSGVIATVTAGIVLGNLGPARERAQDGTDPIDTVWEFIAYLLTAVVFLLVGLAIPPARIARGARAHRLGHRRDPHRPGARGLRDPRRCLASGGATGTRRADPRFVDARAVLGRSARGGGRGDGVVIAGRYPAAGAPPGDHLRGRSCSPCSSRARPSAGSSIAPSAARSCAARLRRPRPL